MNFTTTVVNAEAVPANLTERRFRQFWDEADKMAGNERQQFAAALKAMAYYGKISKDHGGEQRNRHQETR